MKAYQFLFLITAILVICSIGMASGVPLYLNTSNSPTAFSAWTMDNSNISYGSTSAYSTFYQSPTTFPPAYFIDAEASVRYETNTNSISIITEYYFEGDPFVNISGGCEINTNLMIGTAANAPLGTPVNLTIFGNWDGPHATLKIKKNNITVFDEYAGVPELSPISIPVYAGDELTLEFGTGFFSWSQFGEIVLTTEVPEPTSIILMGLGVLLTSRRK